MHERATHRRWGTITGISCSERLKGEKARASTEDRLGVRSKTQGWVEGPLKLGKMQKPAVRKNKTSLERVGRIGEENGRKRMTALQD